MSEIKGKETLVVATSYNPADYFVNKGEPMGFQYDILNELGEHLGVKVEFLIGKSYAQNLQSLEEGSCDLVASGLSLANDTLVTSNSDPLYQAQQVLVQRKPARWRKMSSKQLEKSMVRNPYDLNGKMVYVSGWSPILNGVDFEPERNIRFTKMKGIEPEALVKLVAEGELDYVVCSQSVARLAAAYYDNIDIRTSLGELSVGWIMRSSSSELQKEVNEWLSDFKKTNKYAVLYNRYHKGKNLYGQRAGKISDYDPLFKKYSQQIGWDWRLLASLVCQESRFKPNVRSKRGAYGLMQMMPATLEYFGTDTTDSPEKHIAAGVAYIKHLYKIISPKVSDEEEQLKFVLASYNIGPGHILDAQRLAQKYGRDAEVWENNVDSCLLSKSDPQFYNDPEVRHGKCLGRETQAFVVQILDRYEHYKNIIRN